MNITVRPSKIEGVLSASSSKSCMQRAVAASLLAKGKSTILRPSFSEDCKVALSIVEELGAKVEEMEDRVYIRGGYSFRDITINAGESGLAARIFSAISALGDKTITITGSGSLLKRPMDIVTEPLSKLGVNISTNKGFLPLNIKGPLKGGNLTIDGSLSSQVLSGLLMALPLAEEDSVIKVNNLASKPYIDLTIGILRNFGIHIENNSYCEFKIKGSQVYKPAIYSVEGDWSGSAFFLVMGAIGGSVRVENLTLQSHQPDRKIVEVLKETGADVTTGGTCVTVKRGTLKAFKFDVSDCPDLAPPLVALASYCQGKSILTGTRRLKVKESNRVSALVEEFSRLGVRISNSKNSIEIDGGRVQGGQKHSSHNDHRIAMALATAAVGADNEIEISGAEAVNKSYPTFFDDLKFITSTR